MDYTRAANRSFSFKSALLVFKFLNEEVNFIIIIGFDINWFGYKLNLNLNLTDQFKVCGNHSPKNILSTEKFHSFQFYLKKKSRNATFNLQYLKKFFQSAVENLLNFKSYLCLLNIS